MPGLTFRVLILDYHSLNTNGTRLKYRYTLFWHRAIRNHPLRKFTPEGGANHVWFRDYARVIVP